MTLSPKDRRVEGRPLGLRWLVLKRTTGPGRPGKTSDLSGLQAARAWDAWPLEWLAKKGAAMGMTC